MGTAKAVASNLPGRLHWGMQVRVSCTTVVAAGNATTAKPVHPGLCERRSFPGLVHFPSLRWWAQHLFSRSRRLDRVSQPRFDQ